MILQYGWCGRLNTIIIVCFDAEELDVKCFLYSVD